MVDVICPYCQTHQNRTLEHYKVKCKNCGKFFTILHKIVMVDSSASLANLADRFKGWKIGMVVIKGTGAAIYLYREKGSDRITRYSDWKDEVVVL